jgi:hypothetical protein
MIVVARNDITGDTIQTKGVSEAYRDHYDNIFRKKDTMQVRVTEDSKEFGKCGCGRSPTGKCIGWHALSEEQYKEELKKLYDQEENNK